MQQSGDSILFKNRLTFLSMKKNYTFLLLLLLLVFAGSAVNAQVSITYPAQAKSLTRGLNDSVLTVNVGFTAACSGTTVTVSLPPSVMYVPGTVSKVSGTGAAITITENDISNLNAPVFNLNDITAAGDITFTIARLAGCGESANGKDIITVNGSCGSKTENDPNTNTYNLLSPALSIVPPAAINNAVIGTTDIRTATVTNGGNGALDTLRYYIVYSGGGIINTAGNAITANGVSFTPSSINGDTLFYNIYGTTIFDGDNLLTNGESVTITEPIKVVQCNASTTYGTGWGRTQNEICQTATGTSAVTMVVGVPKLDISFIYTNSPTSTACDGEKITVIYKNNGTENNAGVVYDIQAILGNVGISTPMGRYGFTADDPQLNGTGPMLTYNYAGGDAPNIVDLAQFTSDPDGAGGLQDLDGDGKFNDLAPGDSFKITYTRKVIYNLAACPMRYYAILASQATYNTMCKNVSPISTLINQSDDGYVWDYHGTSKIAPPSVYPGEPFTARICTNGTFAPPRPAGTDSLEVLITLPPGVTYTGTSIFNGDSIPDYAVQTGNILTVREKWLNSNTSSGFCLSFDMVYDCSGSGNLNIPFTIQYVADRSCNAIYNMSCGDSIIIATHCPFPCPPGPTNHAAIVQRTTFGYTDNTLTTKVVPDSLSALSLKTVTVYDSLNIKEGAVQVGSFNNLYYSFQENRAGGGNVFQYLNGTFHFKAGGTGPEIICNLPVPIDSSDYNMEKLTFNISTLLGGSCGLPATLNSNDTFWVDMNFQIANPNNGLLYGATLQTPASGVSYFYNLDALNAQTFCDKAYPEVYVIGLQKDGAIDYNHPRTITGCTSTDYSLEDYRLFENESSDVFPNEYRPVQYVDSVVVTLPTGVYLDPSVPTFIQNQHYSSLFGNSVGYDSVSPIISGNKLSFINPGTWTTSDIASSLFYYNARLSYAILPSCAIDTANTDMTVTYYTHDYYYSGLQPQTISTITRTDALSYNATTAPSISVQNNTGTVQGVLPQQYWDVQINSTGTTTAPYVWMSLEKSSGSGGISIDSVVLEPSGIKLAPNTYNTTDKWYKVSDIGLASGTSQQARVYFKYSSCVADSILLESGWNCTGYPNPDPMTGYACSAAQTWLKVIPEPSQVQLSIARQPGAGDSISLCTNDSVLVIVNSAQAGNLISPSVNINPPTGMDIQLPVQVEYPLGSGIYENATTTVIPGGYTVDLTSVTGIGSNGLPGTVLNPDAAGRQAKLKITYSVSCGISAGSPLTLSAYGDQPCGTPAIGDGLVIQTAGVNIFGASTPGSMGIDLGFDPIVLDCGGSSSITSTTTPVGAATKVGDTVVYTLPAGLKYNGGFKGCAACNVVTTTDPAGVTTVKVALEPGVASGTPLSYSFDVQAAGNNCGTNLTLTALAKRDIPALYCGTTACTSSSIVIGSSLVTGITINKPDLYTQAFIFTQAGPVAGITTVNYSVNISNNGAMAVPATTYIANIYCGTNNSGPLLATFYVDPIAANSGIVQTGSFNYTGVGPCGGPTVLFLQVQDTLATGEKACVCSTPVGVISATVLPVKLESFTAIPQGNNVMLSWKVNEELNVSGYEVEVSTDAINFIKIGNIVAVNNHTYTFLHNSPVNGFNYYRVKITGKDGTITYSPFKLVNFGSGANVMVYPNPAGKNINITVKNSLINTSATISVVAMDGKLIYQKRIKSLNQTETIDVSKIASGKYIIKMITGTEVINKTIQVIH